MASPTTPSFVSQATPCIPNTEHREFYQFCHRFPHTAGIFMVLISVLVHSNRFSYLTVVSALRRLCVVRCACLHTEHRELYQYRPWFLTLLASSWSSSARSSTSVISSPWLRLLRLGASAYDALACSGRICALGPLLDQCACLHTEHRELYQYRQWFLILLASSWSSSARSNTTVISVI
jgi:hypothetical protein